MKIYRVKVIILMIIFFITSNSCSGKASVEIDDWDNWSDYIELNIKDNTVDKDGVLYPEVEIWIKKIAVDIHIEYIYVRLNYDYGYQYFSKREDIILELDSDKLRRLNDGELLLERFKYESCNKIEIMGYDGTDYDIYNPPIGEKTNVNPMIMYGLKIGAMVKKMKFTTNK